MKDLLKAYPFYLIPHHMVSRVIYYLTRLEGKLVQSAIRKFSALFGVNLQEAKIKNINEFKTFNAFFTRELAPDARPIADGNNTLCCPVDGTISQVGRINNDRIFQAKKHDYTVRELLGGDEVISKKFEGGQFNTIYLSPKDYHRIHMPCDGMLTQQIHIPGRLFSVAPFTVNSIPRLFARNERVVALFETDYGAMAMVLVGAINVAAIETVWDGLVTPPQSKTMSIKTYKKNEVFLKKGEEMGRFNMGSTIVWLMNNETLKWINSVQTGDAVKMGEAYMNV